MGRGAGLYFFAQEDYFFCKLLMTLIVLQYVSGYSYGCAIIGTRSADEYEIKFVFVLEIAPVLTRMYLHLHVCEPYKNSYNFADPYADNLELFYLPSTNTQVCICILTHSCENDKSVTAVCDVSMNPN